MKVEYKQYVIEDKARFMKEILEHGDSRFSSRRKRDKDEEKVLSLLDVLRLRRTVKNEKIAYLGGRTYRITLGT
jgi:hypothetical protein